MHSLQDFEKAQLKNNLPFFKSGDTVKVHCKIKEGDKERVQIFEGVVLSRHNAGISSSFTVRKVSYGIGVERVFPLHAPFIERIEVGTVGKVRQSRIYYLRKLSGKKARIASVDTRGQVPQGPTVPEPGEAKGPETEVVAQAVGEEGQVSAGEAETKAPPEGESKKVESAADKTTDS